MISVKTQKNKHNSSDYTPIVTCLDRQQIDTTYIHNIWLNETCRDNMFYTTIFVGPVAQWKRIRLRIWGLQVRSLPGSSFYAINNQPNIHTYKKRKKMNEMLLFSELLIFELQWTSKKYHFIVHSADWLVWIAVFCTIQKKNMLTFVFHYFNR